MLYQPTTTPHIVLGVSITVVTGRTYATVSYNGQRILTTPLVGRVNNKLFIGGTAVSLLVDAQSGIKRGEIVV